MDREDGVGLLVVAVEEVTGSGQQRFDRREEWQPAHVELVSGIEVVACRAPLAVTAACDRRTAVAAVPPGERANRAISETTHFQTP
jgi:hypothetical protein